MNTSQFMDKQIMDLSNSQSSRNEFIDLMKPPEDEISEGSKKEDILPSYDFQPIRPVGGSSPTSNADSGNAGGTRTWNSIESKTNATDLRSYGLLDLNEPTKASLEKDLKVSEASLISEIDRTMKKHADSLLHALEGVSARLSQLETRTRHLENAVDDLKVSVGNNHGSIDGKMRQLEIIIGEVHTGVHVIKDKQEIMEAHLQLAKLQVSKSEKPVEAHNNVHMDSVKEATSASMQSHQQLPPGGFTQSPSTLPPPNAPPPPPPQQNLPQLPNQFPQNQIPTVPLHDSFFPLPGQAQEAPSQQYQMPQPQQLQPPAAPPQQQQYQTPTLQYSQPPPPPPQQLPTLSAHNLPPPPPPLRHPSEESAYVQSQNYPLNIRQPPSYSPRGTPPSQQFYGTPPHAYEPPSSKPSTGFSGAYGPSYGSVEPYPYDGSSPPYSSGSPMKPQQLTSPAMGQSGGSSYPQLPSARILPRALPTASGVGSSSSGSGSDSGNRVPIDDVVDKVTSMGFSRDQVRATVRKLTENGQSVDLNVVLDKLMNDGEGPPQRGWFGR